MKFKHNYTTFRFSDELDNKYDIICKSAKHGENIFSIYKNGTHVANYQPRGCHVNKTTALTILKNTIK